MKKVLWALAGLVLVLIAAVVIVPSMIDWNGYKGLIAAEVKKATGRNLTIAGDVSVSLLPAPVLTADQVAISSIDGAQSPDLAAVRSVEVRIALAPLLGGKIKIETVRLVEPQVFLEVLADGRSSWTITPPAPPPSGDDGPSNAEGASGGSGPTVILDQFEIVGGTLIYQDAASGSLEEVKDINLDVAAASLTGGPYKASGNLVVRGLRVTIAADVGAIVENRTFPLNATLGVGGNSAELQLVGTVLGLNEAPRFRGDATLQSENIARVVEAFADGTELPEPMSQPLKITGGIDASETSLAVENLAIDLGGAKGTGKISGSLNGTPKIAVDVAIDRIDVDPWIKGAESKTAPASGDNAAPPASEAAKSPEPAAAPASAGGFALPNGVNVSLVAKVGEITYKGDRVHNVAVNAELANGELTLSQASLQAPGGTDLAVFGFLAGRDGQPSFDASVDLKVRNPRKLMDWAGVDASMLKPGKPGSLSLTGRIGGTPTSINFRELALAVDKTNIRGAATVAVRDRVGIGASVTVDQLNLDDYLAETPAPKTAPKADPKSETKTESAPAAGATPPSQVSDTGPFEGLKALTGFDANVHASVGSLTTQGVPIKDVAADLSLVNGDLTIKKFNVGNVAGAGIAASGQVKGLGGTPTASKLALRARANDVSGLAKLAGTELPLPAKTIGPVEASMDLNGRLDAPTVASTIKAMAATITANGSVRPFDTANLVDLGVDLKHDDFAALMKRLGTGYTPSGKIGGLVLNTRVKGGLAHVELSGLTAVVGAARVGGDAGIDLAGAVPKIDAYLQTGALVVDPFLPAQKSASLEDAPARVIPAAFKVEGTGANPLRHFIASVSDRWSRAPVDLSGLTAVNANVRVTSPSITYHEYKLEGAKLTSVLTDGVLKVNEFTGKVFGGDFASTASVDASKARPTLGGSFSVSGMDVGAASAAAGIAGGSGRLTTRADVTSDGRSVADWIGSLSGRGAIEVKGIKGQQSLSDMPVIGLVLGPLMQVFEVLNSGLGTLLGAGANTGIGQTDVTSTYTISNGVVTTKDTQILSNIYKGNIAGDVNLPLWSMNVGGDIAVDQGFLGTVLSNVVRVPSSIPFQVTGNIDKPNVKIQSFNGSTSQGGEGIAIPGLDKLEKKAPGVGGLIQGILGGGKSEEQKTEPTEQQPPQQQQEKNPLNQLLRGLIR